MWVHMYMRISCTFKYVVHYLPQNLVYTHLHATLVCTLVPVNTCDTPEMHYVEMDVTSTCFVCSTTCMVYSYSGTASSFVKMSIMLDYKVVVYLQSLLLCSAYNSHIQT